MEFIIPLKLYYACTLQAAMVFVNVRALEFLLFDSFDSALELRVSVDQVLCNEGGIEVFEFREKQRSNGEPVD